MEVVSELFMTGLRIEYTGDACNASGRGVVVETFPSDRWGGPYATIVLEDGRELVKKDARHFVPVEQKEGCRHRILYREGEYAQEGEIAALRACAALAKADAEAKKIAAQQARIAERERLKTEHPYLTVKGEHDSGGVFVAKNVRKVLKKHFPGVTFRVTSSYTTVNVRWEDGPTGADVRAQIDRFQEGSFNGMTDCYDYAAGPWNDAFGGCRYVFCSRNGYLV